MVKHIFSQLSIFPTRSFNKRGTDIDRVVPSFFYSFEKTLSEIGHEKENNCSGIYVRDNCSLKKLELAICTVPALSFQMPFLLFR